MPLISVIVPVYKAEAFLKKCTDSILSQSHREIELLLIDDGSPDNSGALCDAIAAEDTRVRVFHKENGGVSSARNLGLAHATGDYIAFVDSDDWLEPDTFSLLLSALTENGADSAGCGNYNVSDSGITGWNESYIGTNEGTTETASWDLGIRLEDGRCFHYNGRGVLDSGTPQQLYTLLDTLAEHFRK